MTFNHPFWAEQDIAGGRRALAKLGRTRAERAAKAATAREREYLNAVADLYGDGDKDERDFAFANAMQAVAMHYPDDYEAAAFYVLALLSTRRIGDSTYPQNQATAGAILKAILDKYPNHPGALHYLMHTYDDPEHASLALAAARKYEMLPIADSNFHAIHMPAHIYQQLGMWTDVARLNQFAFDASDRWVRSRNLPIARRDYHSLDFLDYAQLQMGQYDQARASVSLLLESAQQARMAPLTEAAAVMTSRFAIETGDWDVLSRLPATSRVPEALFARALASLNRSVVDVAKKMSATLDEVIQADRTAMRLNHAAAEEVLKRLLSARIALAEKRFADADRLGLEAVELERKIETPPELSGIVKPPAEFYGEILLELKKPDEAATQFAAALKQRPKRGLALLGLARTRVMQNDKPGATEAYKELAEIWKDADESNAAVREVREFLRRTPD